MTRSKLLIALLLVAATAVAAEPNKKEKKNKGAEPAQLVDAGSFGVFINGRRVATENFKIEQRPSGSVVSSEFTVEDGGQTAHTSELQIGPAGEMREYHWRELRPGKAENIVRFSENFISQQVALNPKDKPRDLSYILPATTQVIDDYFFSHLEILLWRYLRGGCDGKGICNLVKTQFGIFVPRRETPAIASMQFRGKEKVMLRGAEVDAARFALVIEGEEWALWMQDSDKKLVRIQVPANNTEIIRD